MAKDYKEWFRQSDYDYETALFMHESGRYFYAVFMCHLSIEKALKGLYLKRTKIVPLKIHKLMYFIDKLSLEPNEDFTLFIAGLDSAGVATRYPDSLKIISSEYKRKNTLDILKKAEELLQWLKKELIK